MMMMMMVMMMMTMMMVMIDDDDDDDDDDVYTKDRKPDRQRDKVAFPIQRLTTIEKQRVFNRICLNFC